MVEVGCVGVWYSENGCTLLQKSAMLLHQHLGLPIQLIISEIVCLISLDILKVKIEKSEFDPTTNDLQVVKR